MKHNFKFSDWLLNEITLYHGTVTDNEPGILTHGLIPNVGDFTSSAYGVEDKDYSNDDHAVYMSNKQDLSKATTAMVSAIAKKLHKSEHEVTDQEIEKNGLLCIIEDPDNTITQKQDDNIHHPKFAEPRDYYSRDIIKPNQILKGSSLVRFLKRYHAWPITWTLKNLSKSEDNYLRGKLVANAIKRHPDKSAEEIKNKVASLSPKNAETLYQQYYQK